MPLVLLVFTLFIGDLLNLLIVVGVVEVVIILASLVKLWFHVIIIIILIEFLGLKVFLFSSFMVRGFINNIFLILFLVFMVIEASLGMRLVGILSRLSSNQSIKV